MSKYVRERIGTFDVDLIRKKSLRERLGKFAQEAVTWIVALVVLAALGKVLGS